MVEFTDVDFGKKLKSANAELEEDPWGASFFNHPNPRYSNHLVNSPN